MEGEEKTVMSADAPPPYAETVTGGGDAPPPYSEVVRGMSEMTGYSNLRSGMQRVRESSDNQERAKGFWDLCCGCCGSVICSCCFLIMAAWPIALVVVGSIDLNNCRANHLIPVWMIVFGVVSVVMTCISTGKQCFCRQKKKEEEEDGDGRNRGRQGTNCVESLLITFLMVWVFVGSGWVFPLYNVWQAGNLQSCQVMNGTLITSRCCEPRTFLFAFGSLLTMYSFALLCCCLLCVGACVAACVVILSSDDD